MHLLKVRVFREGLLCILFLLVTQTLFAYCFHWLTGQWDLTTDGPLAPFFLMTTCIGLVLWLRVPPTHAVAAWAVLYWDMYPLLCLGVYIVLRCIFLYKEPEEESVGHGEYTPPPQTHQRPIQWWEVLGIDATASVDEIKSAYRRLAKQSHPDSPGGMGNSERFRQIHTAYQEGLRYSR